MHLLVVLISYLLFCIFISFDTEMGVFVSREMVWESKGMFGTLTETDHLRSWVFFVDCVDFLSDVASVDCLAFC